MKARIATLSEGVGTASMAFRSLFASREADAAQDAGSIVRDRGSAGEAQRKHCCWGTGPRQSPRAGRSEYQLETAADDKETDQCQSSHGPEQNFNHVILLLASRPMFRPGGCSASVRIAPGARHGYRHPPRRGPHHRSARRPRGASGRPRAGGAGTSPRTSRWRDRSM